VPLARNTDNRVLPDYTMDTEDEVLASEDRFFQALLGGDRAALENVLTPDFLMIDVMTGSEIPGPVLAGLIGSRQLVFERVDRIDARVRIYGAAAVVTGQTRMQGRYDEQGFGAHSRYTHVYVSGVKGWQLASAQGTPIAAG
jgi:ketosteroid isomerase-like protein